MFELNESIGQTGVIKVVGVGDAGCKAIKGMISANTHNIGYIGAFWTLAARTVAWPN